VTGWILDFRFWILDLLRRKKLFFANSEFKLWKNKIFSQQTNPKSEI